MAALEIHAQTLGGVSILHLQGEMDAFTAPRLRAALETLIAQEHPAILLELCELTYLDSIGLGVLIAGLKQVSEKLGQFVLVSPTPPVSRILRITGMDNLFAIFDDEAEAQRQLRVG